MLSHYRMGEYKISELGKGDLRWEAHSGFASVSQGRCHIIGELLCIGPALHEEPGAFKGDYYDSLKPLPCWDFTKFYCENCVLYSCVDRRRLTWDQLTAIKAGDCGSNKGRLNTSGPARPSINHGKPQKIMCNLSGYEVTRNPDSSLCWRARSGSRGIKTGDAYIKEGILFLEAGRQEPYSYLHDDFRVQLNRLPKWHETKYFATQAKIFACPIPQAKRSLLVLPQRGKKDSLNQARKSSLLGFIGKKISNFFTRF